MGNLAGTRLTYRLVNGAWIKDGGSPPKQAIIAPKTRKMAERRGDLSRAKLDGVAMPYDAEVEQSVLGSMLIEIVAVRAARHVLRIRDAGIHEPGCGEYLFACVDRVVTASHVLHHAKIVAGLYLERQIIKSAYKVADGQRGEELQKLAQLHIEKVSLTCPVTFNYETGMATVLNEILKDENSKRFQTHYPSIDKLWHGQKRGELNVWGGATNEGKSLFLLNLMDRAARAGERCLYIGTEMTSVETVERHLSVQSGVEAWKIRIPKFDSKDMSKLQETVKVMSRMNVSILDDPEPSLAKVEAAIQSSKADIIFLDYLERFEMPRADQLRLQIKEFMRQLKNLVRRTGTVGHLAAQLNRDTYGAEQRPPTLADLSESSAIEKEADRVGLLWTPPPATQTASSIRSGRVPSIKVGPKAFDSTLGEHCRLIQIINAKSRHCPKGFVFEFVVNSVNLKIQEMDEYNDPFNKPV